MKGIKALIVTLALFLVQGVQADTTITVGDVVSGVTSGSTYLISAGDGSYLYDNGGSLAVGSSVDASYVWTITSSGSYYTIQNSSTGNYLYVSVSRSGGGMNNNYTASYTLSSSSATNYIVFDGTSVAIYNTYSQSQGGGNFGNQTTYYGYLTATGSATYATALTNAYVLGLTSVSVVKSADTDLATGIYYIRSKAYRDNNTNTESFMSSLTNVTGLCAEATNYWSIWEVTLNTDGTYTLVNQGNRDVYTPGQLISANPKTDNGILYYDSSDTELINVGSPTDESTYKMALTKVTDGDLTYYQIGNGSNDVVLYGKDNVIKFISSSTTSDGQYSYYHEWEFIPVTETANYDGINETRHEKFERVVNELEGYVGGVTTMHNVSSVFCLNDIVNLRDAGIAAIDAKSDFTFTPTCNAYDTSLFTGLSGTAPSKIYAAIMRMVGTIRETDSLTQYYQALYATTSELDHPFFVENICGNRSAYGVRICEYTNATDQGPWSALEIEDDNYVATNATFYIENPSTDTDVYIMKNGNGNYFGDALTGSNNWCVSLTTTASDAFNFKIDPVIPGVWQMERSEHRDNTSTSRDFVTITGHGTIHCYYLVETSALWKFHTYNHIPDIVLNQDPDDVDDSGNVTETTDYYGTFSYELDCRVPATYTDANEQTKNNPVPYYCTAAYKDTKSPAVLLVFQALETYTVDHDTKSYLLSGNEGYLFKIANGTNDMPVDSEGATTKTITTGKTVSGGIYSKLSESEKTNYTGNLLLPNFTKTTIADSTEWKNTFALTYNGADELIGYYNGDRVYGMGVGFYHIPVGGTLKANSAIIYSSSFTEVDFSTSDICKDYVYKNWTGNTSFVEPSGDTSTESTGSAAKMIFLDSEGELEEVVDAIVDITDQTATIKSIGGNAVYDMTGRRVSKPVKGIYIVDGKKVLY